MSSNSNHNNSASPKKYSLSQPAVTSKKPRASRKRTQHGFFGAKSFEEIKSNLLGGAPANSPKKRKIDKSQPIKIEGAATNSGKKRQTAEKSLKVGYKDIDLETLETNFEQAFYLVSKKDVATKSFMILYGYLEKEADIMKMTTINRNAYHSAKNFNLIEGRWYTVRGGKLDQRVANSKAINVTERTVFEQFQEEKGAPSYNSMKENNDFKALTGRRIANLSEDQLSLLKLKLNLEEVSKRSNFDQITAFDHNGDYIDINSWEKTVGALEQDNWIFLTNVDRKKLGRGDKIVLNSWGPVIVLNATEEEKKEMKTPGDNAVNYSQIDTENEFVRATPITIQDMLKKCKEPSFSYQCVGSYYKVEAVEISEIKSVFKIVDEFGTQYVPGITPGQIQSRITNQERELKDTDIIEYALHLTLQDEKGSNVMLTGWNDCGEHLLRTGARNLFQLSIDEQIDIQNRLMEFQYDVLLSYYCKKSRGKSQQNKLFGGWTAVEMRASKKETDTFFEEDEIEIMH